MKHYFNLGILLLALSFLFVSCQDDFEKVEQMEYQASLRLCPNQPQPDPMDTTEATPISSSYDNVILCISLLPSNYTPNLESCILNQFSVVVKEWDLYLQQNNCDLESRNYIIDLLNGPDYNC